MKQTIGLSMLLKKFQLYPKLNQANHSTGFFFFQKKKQKAVVLLCRRLSIAQTSANPTLKQIIRQVSSFSRIRSKSGSSASQKTFHRPNLS
jgi:hypothetical protein